MTERTDPADRVLIAVPTLNEAANIERIVRQLLEDAPDRTMLAIADGGSDDGTRQVAKAIAARDPRVRLVQNPGRLQSAGVNRVVAELGAGADVLVRADAHADYPPGFVATLLAEQHRTQAAAVAVGVESRAGSGFAFGVAAAQNSFLGTGGAAHRVGGKGQWIDHGHNALFRLDAFRSVGGYDESFRHNEDAEIDHRLGLAGHRVWLTDRTRHVYYPRRTPGALWRQYLNYGYGRASMLLKHRHRPRARQVAPLTVPLAAALAVIGAVAAIATGSAVPLILAAPVVAWAVLCLGFAAVIAIRFGRSDALWAGPTAMISHFAWAVGFLRRVVGRGEPARYLDPGSESHRPETGASPEPDVSVVIAAYRAEKSILEAVESALAQQDVRVEVIVVDDASTDRTVKIVDAIGDPRVRWTGMPVNSGPAAARNAGMAIARGRWLAVLDADDAMVPGRLRAMIDRAVAERADAVIDDLLVESHASPPGRMFGRALRGQDRIELAAFMRGNRLFRGVQLGYAKPLFGAAFLRENELSYDPALRVGEDYQLLAACLAAGGRVAILDAPLYRYRRRAGSISHRLGADEIMAMIEADRRFARRWRLGEEERAALRARAAAFRDGLAFTEAVDAVKARDFARASRAIARRPAAALQFRRPLGARLNRLVSRSAPAARVRPFGASR